MDALEDPWLNGWATADDNAADSHNTTTVSPTVLHPPPSYSTLYDLTNAYSPHQFLDRLVSSSILSSSLRDDILLASSSPSLSSLSQASRFFAVVALHLESPSHPDSFESRSLSLPQIPQLVIDVFSNAAPTPHLVTDLFSNTTPTPHLVPDLFSNTDSAPQSDPLTDHLAATRISSPPLPHLPSDSSPVDVVSIKNHFASIRGSYSLTPSDSVKIREVPEKEGLVFKHVNYMISHDLSLGVNGPAGPKKVIRRYSDFSWYVTTLQVLPLSPLTSQPLGFLNFCSKSIRSASSRAFLLKSFRVRYSLARSSCFFTNQSSRHEPRLAVSPAPPPRSCPLPQPGRRTSRIAPRARSVHLSKRPYGLGHVAAPGPRRHQLRVCRREDPGALYPETVARSRALVRRIVGPGAARLAPLHRVLDENRLARGAPRKAAAAD